MRWSSTRNCPVASLRAGRERGSLLHCPALSCERNDSGFWPFEQRMESRSVLAGTSIGRCLPAKHLKIATFNVNGARSRLPHLVAWLEKEKPDIACLRELKSIDEGFSIVGIRDAGYGALWKGQ